MGGSDLRYNDDMIVSVGMDQKELEVYRGEVWHFGSGYQSLIDTDYIIMHFVTPATGLVTYTFSDTRKSGGEITTSLYEASTWVATASSDLVGRCMNRNYADTGCPFTTFKIGTRVNGNVITPGTLVIPALLLGGTTASGVARAFASGSVGGVLYLKPATAYDLMVLSVGSTTKVTVNLSLVYEK